MAERLAFYVGSSTPFNVRLDIRHYVWMLRNRFEIDLVATDFSSFDTETLESVNRYNHEQRSNRRGEYRALRSYLDSRDPVALVHVTRTNLLPSVVASVAKAHGVPVVYRYGADELYTYRIARGWKKIGYFVRNNMIGRLMFQLADAYMVFGPCAQRRLVTRGCEPDNIVKLPPPFDPDRFATTSDESVLCDVPTDRDIVLFVGRRIRHKGFDYLVERIPTLLEVRPSLHFVFVGGGGREPDLPTWATDHVTVVGRVDPEAIGSYFEAADLLVHPTLTDAFGRVIVEAQLAGTRTLARDVGDVSVATANTFITDREFINAVADFEDLPREDGERFSRERLRPQYQKFFQRFVDKKP